MPFAGSEIQQKFGRCGAPLELWREPLPTSPEAKFKTPVPA
jgi:hypothetical protein